MPYRAASLAFAVSACLSTAAAAQQTTPRSVQANMLGLMEYCQAQGLTSAEAVAAQRKLMNHTAPGGPVEEAEATGKKGTIIMLDDPPRTIEQTSAIHQTTVAHTCEMMGKVAMRNASRP